MSKESLASRLRAQAAHDLHYDNETIDLLLEAAEALAEQPAQQEPVAWMHPKWRSYTRAPAVSITPKEGWHLLYTTPQPPAQPAREWVGLTDEDKEFIAKRASVYDWHDYEVIEASEAKLKEKNNG